MEPQVLVLPVGNFLLGFRQLLGLVGHTGHSLVGFGADGVLDVLRGLGLRGAGFHGAFRLLRFLLGGYALVLLFLGHDYRAPLFGFSSSGAAAFGSPSLLAASKALS